jgi:hypothetical protein
MIELDGERVFISVPHGIDFWWFEVDPEDAERVAEHKWSLFGSRRPHTYIRGRGHICIAELLLGDHPPGDGYRCINGNSMDCRKANFCLRSKWYRRRPRILKRRDQ